MSIERLAVLSVHTSPLATLGGKKTGGMNVYVRELAQELGRRGIQVDIFTRRTSPFELEIDESLGENVRVIHIAAGPINVLPPDAQVPFLSEFTARLMAFTTMRGIHYDIIYSHYWLSGWVAQKLKEAWGTPFVQMFHTLGYMKQRIVHHSSPMPDERINTETLITRWADRIVAATPAEYSQLLWLYRARRQKIEVIPPGVNTDRFQPTSSASAREQLGLADNTRFLLFVGRIEPLKAVDTILEALSLLRSQDAELLENVRFIVIGGDPEDENDPEMFRLNQQAHELHLDDITLFLGAREQSVLPLYYAAASAVIMPSDYESFGMVALEAMASGTPVIASEVGGLAFLVRENETGFLIPVREPGSLAERIRRIIAEPDASARMGRRASQLALEYAWPRIADRLLDVFRDILSADSSRTLNRHTS